jgi:predicted MFS family arabinose efflux permease
MRSEKHVEVFTRNGCVRSVHLTARSYGRRVMFRTSILCALFASMVSALAGSFAVFVVLRFASGFAIGA